MKLCSLDDFPGGNTNNEFLPEIEVHTIVHDHAPGSRWITVDPISQEKTVMEKWTWVTPGPPKRQGFDVDKGSWDEDGVPWGAPNVANSYRPKPHRVDAFADPKIQADAIVKLLADIIKEKVKSVQEQADEESQYKQLLKTITTLRQQVVNESNTHIEKIILICLINLIMLNSRCVGCQESSPIRFRVNRGFFILSDHILVIFKCQEYDPIAELCQESSPIADKVI
jgi:predicted Zn-ribbon and HTH transcriptional regulator